MWSYEHLYLTCFCLFQSHNLASIFVPTKAKSLIISMVYFRGCELSDQRRMQVCRHYMQPRVRYPIDRAAEGSDETLYGGDGR